MQRSIAIGRILRFTGVVLEKTKKEQQTEIDSLVIGTRITRPMHQALTKLVQFDSHFTISEYLRDLLRRDLESKGFLKTEAQTA
jgi:hypothetical protein